jgi:flagellin
MSANTAIALTVGMRNSLYALSDVESQITMVNKRLATGKKVNSALDDPLNYFLAQGFDRDKRDLANLLDSQNLGLQTLQKTVKTIDSITKLTESIQALGRQARTSQDATARNTLGAQVGILLQQIDELTEDAGFNGRNLLDATPSTLTVEFNTATGTGRTQLVVNGTSLRGNSADIALHDNALVIAGNAAASGNIGVTFTAATLPDPHTYAFSSAVGSWEVNAAGDARLDTFLARTQVALNNLEARAASYSINLTVLQVRIDYSKAAQRNFGESIDMLTGADINEEGANLSALQTRQQLAVTSLSLANRSDQSVLRLFN